MQSISKPAHSYFFQFLKFDNFILALDIRKRMGNMESFNTLIFFMASTSFWRNKVSLQL